MSIRVHCIFHAKINAEKGQDNATYALFDHEFVETDNKHNLSVHVQTYTQKMQVIRAYIMCNMNTKNC